VGKGKLIPRWRSSSIGYYTEPYVLKPVIKSIRVKKLFVAFGSGATTWKRNSHRRDKRRYTNGICMGIISAYTHIGGQKVRWITHKGVTTRAVGTWS
jgi:hypothetical protein